jgi:hypothetical protein
VLGSQKDQHQGSHKEGSGMKYGGAGSVRSGSSGSDASSVSEVLRRGVLTRSAHLERSLVVLKRALIFVFCVIAILNIAAVTVTTSLFREMDRNIDLVVNNGDRALFLNRAFAALQSLVFEAEETFIIPEGADFFKGRVDSSVTRFESLHRDLYLTIDGSDADEAVLYKQPVIKVQNLIPGTFNSIVDFQTTERDLGLANAGLEMVSKIRLANALPAPNVTYDDVDVFYVLHNAHYGTAEAMNRSLMLADARSRTHADNVLLANIVVCAVAEVMLTAIVLTIMMPALKQVLRSKNLIFATFLEVPMPVIRALRARVQRKIEAIQRAADSEDVAIDIDMEDDLELEIKADSSQHSGASSNDMDKALTGAADQSLSSIWRNKDGVGSSFLNGQHIDGSSAKKKGCCGCLSRSSDGAQPSTFQAKKRHRRRYSNMRSSSADILFGMVWPIVVFMIYFGWTFSWKQTVVTEARYIRNEILWSMQQRFLLSRTNFQLRDAYAYCDPKFVEHSLNQSQADILMMEMVTDALMYGSPSLNVRSGIQIMPEINHVAMINGCTDTTKYYYPMENCTQLFYGGIFSRGMMQGFKEFANDVRLLILLRREQLAADPTGVSLCANPQGSGTDRYPLNDKMVNDVDQMRWRYLAAPLNRIATIRIANAHSVFQTFSRYDLGLTLACIAALILFYYVIYSPLIRRLDKDIKEVRLLLLLFPDDVSRAVPVIAEVGRQLVKDTASVASSQA